MSSGIDAATLRTLVPSWGEAMLAAGRSRATVKVYAAAVLDYVAWAQDRGPSADLSKDQVTAWLSSQLDAGFASTTVESRLVGARGFSAWLATEGKIDADQLAGLRAPKFNPRVPDPMWPDEVESLLAACEGDALADARDLAITRFMIETGTRAGECAALSVGDVDLTASVVTTHRAGGRYRGRPAALWPRTAGVFERYLRLRADDPRAAESPHLWLGDGAERFTDEALREALRTRADRAGIDRFDARLLRHVTAQRWLAAIDDESGT